MALFSRRDTCACEIPVSYSENKFYFKRNGFGAKKPYTVEYEAEVFFEL